MNTQSKTHAIGWSGLFNGFGGKDSAKMEPWQLLPFPDLAETKVKRLSSKTAHILASLIEGSSLPQRIIGTVRQFDEIVELIDEAS
ncbi:hypothetical protein H6G00_00685 [Leptolyngbya sp. FACHB-541]|uniref:hypothetical protein n=1 Tax=Leptolyngbya sp. FACHB-541 TaxID=2692810 RepID=UPI001682D4A7|nr:hypothetical protein [Leptolyngbya sp. FACHB-541]MBD1995143.1 hypothetical protein [Leptolyngbya sp. FACHB-541]